MHECERLRRPCTHYLAHLDKQLQCQRLCLHGPWVQVEGVHSLEYGIRGAHNVVEVPASVRDGATVSAESAPYTTRTYAE